MARPTREITGRWVACSDRLPPLNHPVFVRGDYIPGQPYPQARLRVLPDNRIDWSSGEWRGQTGIHYWFDCITQEKT